LNESNARFQMLKGFIGGVQWLTGVAADTPVDVKF